MTLILYIILKNNTVEEFKKYKLPQLKDILKNII